MSLEPFKYLLQPVAIERDEDGRIVREISGEVIPTYSVEQASEAIRTFETHLQTLQQEVKDAGGGSNGSSDHVRQPELSGEPAGSD